MSKSKTKTKPIKLTEMLDEIHLRTIATLCSALRFWQRKADASVPEWIGATFDGESVPLQHQEISSLVNWLCNELTVKKTNAPDMQARFMGFYDYTLENFTDVVELSVQLGRKRRARPPLKFPDIKKFDELKRPALKAFALARLILIMHEDKWKVDITDALERVTSEFPLSAHDAAAVRAAYVLICN